MTVNCTDDMYAINFTDSTKNYITVNKKAYLQNKLDITLLGKKRKEYGKIFNENILHILENFSCPEDSNTAGLPDLNATIDNILGHPTSGQIWFNSTQKRLFVFDGINWNPLASNIDVAGNSGIIADGSYLPRPIDPVTGYEFSYNECVWIVSPFNFPAEIDYMTCNVDSNGLVTSKYRILGGSLTNGYASYQILGIRNNINEGIIETTTTPIPTASPQITVSPTPTPLANSTPTPTPSATLTPTPTTSLNVSPTPTPTNTISVTVSLTPSITPTKTVTPTPTLTPTPSLTPSTSISALSAQIFIDPSLGYPDGANTQIPSPCSMVNQSSCDYSLGVLVKNITGGVAPYTIDYSNIVISGEITDNNTNSYTSLLTSYAGGSGTVGNPIRTGLTSASTASMSFKVDFPTHDLCITYLAFLKINGGSYITITDSIGDSITLYTPSGLEGNVYGTSYQTPQGDYKDSWSLTPYAPNCQ